MPKLFDLSDETAGSEPVRRILVVDDSRLQRQILVRMLRRWGFAVTEAESGEAALEICNRDRPEMVLSDWMMPGMTGLDFCRAFRDQSGDGYGYFILLTSKTDKAAVAQGLDAGADDFLSKPVDADELRARIKAGERILGMQHELSAKNSVISETLEKLQAAYDRIDEDLVQARKIQQSLVPERNRCFGASQVSLLLKPSGHIGGDLVGMFSPRDDQVGFYSIDVSGHGITSALMTARLGGHLNAVHFDENLAMSRKNGAYSLREPGEVAATLNGRLLAHEGVEEYFTMAYAMADLATGRVKLTQAGHPHPLLIRRDGGMELVGEGGLPVGLLPDARFDHTELTMQPGDRLLLYSDGFTECPLGRGGMLGDDGLKNLVRRCISQRDGKAFLDALFRSLTRIMCPVTGMDDDVSATLFDFGAPG
ncbi:PP2C family protein-serine/threonine phosphatase [Pukyongiella litopenaei]|uniref:PP2C family protein-serine/threonine phosphatase n=1 Tax=Pukyongiella litopenaei TaxID=2605946 RepID=UPI001FCEB81A|nr:SpoIIE family protein phosphatase [Pukyongiella litopenaei]